jgi:SCP-2 sterol transfer family
MAKGVSALLRRSVAPLADEVPASYGRVLDSLDALVVQLDVDGELFSLSGGDGLHVADGAAQSAGATITTSRAVILDVLDGRLGLQHAVEAGALSVLGALDDVLRAHDTLLAYVHAAVRAPSQPELLAELRTGAP